MTKPAPKILIIEWFDPHEEGDTWEEFKIGEDKAVVACTVGTLLEETDVHYLLAFNRAEDGTYMRKGFIPKSHIRRVKELKYPWKHIGSPLTKVRKKKEIVDGT